MTQGAQAPVPESHPYAEGRLIYGDEYAELHPRFRKSVPKCRLSDEDARAKVGFKKSLALVEYENTTVFSQYRRMPVITFNSIPIALKETDNTSKRCYNARGVPVDHLQNFVKEVKEFGFMSFDTEGRPRAQMIQLGTYRGTCFYFSPLFDEKDLENSQYDWSHFPPQLRHLLSDEHIIKITSDPWVDKELLAREGITVNSCVDTRLLFQYTEEFEKVAPKTKLAVIVKHMLKQSWAKRPHEYIWVGSKLSTAAKKHACQDVRAPLLFLVTLAHRLSPNPENLSPLIMQMLFMHLEINSDPTQFVKAKSMLAGVWPKHQHGPHDIKTVHWLMDTCPYFVAIKDYPPLEALLPDGGHPTGRAVLTRKDNTELQRVVQQNWEGHSPAVFDYVRVTENPTGWCPHCGKPFNNKSFVVDHSNCLERNKSCDYPFCDLFEGHATIFCPVLHGTCDICGRRGHRSELHERFPEDSLPLLSIEYATLNWSPLGKNTCVPFLELTPRADEVLDKHWRYLTTNQKRIASQRTFAILSIPYVAPKCKPKRQRHPMPGTSPAVAQKRKASSSSDSGFKIPKKVGQQTASQQELGYSTDTSTDTTSGPVAGPSGLQQSGSTRSKKGKGKGKSTATLQSRHVPETRPGAKTSVAKAMETVEQRAVQTELELLRKENQMLRGASEHSIDAETLNRIRLRAEFLRRFMDGCSASEESEIDLLIKIDVVNNPQFYGPDLATYAEQGGIAPTPQLVAIASAIVRRQEVVAGTQTAAQEEYVPPGDVEMAAEYNPTPSQSDQGSSQEPGKKQEATPGKKKRAQPNPYCSSESSDEDSELSGRQPPDYVSDVDTPPPSPGKTTFFSDARMSPAEDRAASDQAISAILGLDLNPSESSTNEGSKPTEDEPQTSRSDKPGSPGTSKPAQ